MYLAYKFFKYCPLIIQLMATLIEKQINPLIPIFRFVFVLLS